MSQILDPLFSDNGVPGYITLPGGLILQWGQNVADATPGSTYTFTFPVAFPNACLGVQLTELGTGNADAKLSAATPTTSGLTVHVNGTTDATGVMYFAIGH